jgi:ketosteroid isomerase-like protein
MHPSNIAVVRDIVDALNRADIDGALAHMDPDFEWTPLEGSPAAGVCRGHAQVRRYVQDWLDTLDTLRLDLKDPVEAGDTVVVEVDGGGRGGTSGIQLSDRFWQVWTLAGGSALKMHEYRTREEAHRALAASARSGSSTVGS